MEAEPTSESGMLQRHLQRLSVQAFYRSHWATLTCLIICQSFILAVMQAGHKSFEVMQHAENQRNVPGQISMKSTRMEKHRAFAASQPVKLTHATLPRTSLWIRFLGVPGWTLDILDLWIQQVDTQNSGRTVHNSRDIGAMSWDVYGLRPGRPLTDICNIRLRA